MGNHRPPKGFAAFLMALFFGSSGLLASPTTDEREEAFYLLQKIRKTPEEELHLLIAGEPFISISTQIIDHQKILLKIILHSILARGLERLLNKNPIKSPLDIKKYGVHVLNLMGGVLYIPGLMALEMAWTGSLLAAGHEEGGEEVGDYGLSSPWFQARYKTLRAISRILKDKHLVQDFYSVSGGSFQKVVNKSLEFKTAQVMEQGALLVQDVLIRNQKLSPGEKAKLAYSLGETLVLLFLVKHAEDIVTPKKQGILSTLLKASREALTEEELLDTPMLDSIEAWDAFERAYFPRKGSAAESFTEPFLIAIRRGIGHLPGGANPHPEFGITLGFLAVGPQKWGLKGIPLLK
jgi:hypothetical protein